MGTAVWFAVAMLATWRLTHLLVWENGPGHLIARFRRMIAHGRLGGVVGCFNCLSLWIALPFALFVGRNVLDGLVIWLGLSGGAVLLERWTRDPFAHEPLLADEENKP